MFTTNFIDRLIALGDRIDHEEMHRALRAVAKERDFLRAIFDSMVEGVLVLTRAGRVTFLNRAAKHLLALRAEDREFDSIEECIFDPDLRERIETAHDERDRLIDEEVVTRYRHQRILLVNVVPIDDGGQNAIGSIVLLLDITQRKENENRLHRAEHLASLTTVFAGLAHEIRNPLNSMGIHIQLSQRALRNIAQETDCDVGKIQDHLQIVTGEVDRLNQVVERFLNAVKEKPLAMGPCEVTELLTSTVQLLQPELEKESVQVEFRTPEEPVVVWADREDLRLALINLLRNAIEAMPGGGDIQVTVETQHDEVRLRIQDNGVGIRESDLDRIFDPYFTTRAEGTGLGLMIVNRVVKEHGGRIDVHSQLGIGTEFLLIFPRYRGGPKLIEMTPEPASGSTAS